MGEDTRFHTKTRKEKKEHVVVAGAGRMMMWGDRMRTRIRDIAGYDTDTEEDQEERREERRRYVRPTGLYSPMGVDYLTPWTFV